MANEASRLTEKYFLRGYDAVQLAIALEVQKIRVVSGTTGLVFVSADSNLNIAAQAEGLAVENPNNYP